MCLKQSTVVTHGKSKLEKRLRKCDYE